MVDYSNFILFFNSLNLEKDCVYKLIALPYPKTIFLEQKWAINYT
jgi:hypothetical protein